MQYFFIKLKATTEKEVILAKPPKANSFFRHLGKATEKQVLKLIKITQASEKRVVLCTKQAKSNPKANAKMVKACEKQVQSN